jgi:hypothetical protein
MPDRSEFGRHHAVRQWHSDHRRSERPDVERSAGLDLAAAVAALVRTNAVDLGGTLRTPQRPGNPALGRLAGATRAEWPAARSTTTDG